MWYILTNQRPVYRSRDLSEPNRDQYSSHMSGPIRSQYSCHEISLDQSETHICTFRSSELRECCSLSCLITIMLWHDLTLSSASEGWQQLRSPWTSLIMLVFISIYLIHRQNNWVTVQSLSTSNQNDESTVTKTSLWESFLPGFLIFCNAT